MAPGYSPYSRTSGDTGLAQLLAQQHNEAVKVSESMRIDQMGREVRELRYLIDEIDRKITVDVYTTPEPSVETVGYSSPNWFIRIINDPIWEIFKRPSLK